MTDPALHLTRTTDHPGLPEPLPHDVLVVPGQRVGTALRLRIDPAHDTLMLEHMAFNHSIGWYRQRLTTLPKELLGELATGLRRAACLMNAAAPVAASSDLRLSEGDAA